MNIHKSQLFWCWTTDFPLSPVPSDFWAAWIHGHFSMGNETDDDDDDDDGVSMVINGYYWILMDIYY